MSSNDAVIRVNGLGKSYRIYDRPHHRLLQGLFRSRVLCRDFAALHDVNMEVRKGETIGVVGRNGSGKSTLLQIICGTLAPTYGEVEVKGRIAALLELGAGFNIEFTGRENAYLNAAILGLSREEINQRFDKIEAFAEIGEFIDHPVKTYSSGMFVRLAFSVAIHVEPNILIVDEALAVGDARFQSKCLNAIKRMRDGGTTILFVSHDVGSVRALCDRSIWLDRGQVRMQGEVFPVTAQYTQFLFEDEQQVIDMRPEPEPVPDAPEEASVDGETPAEAMDASRPINHWGSHVGSIISAGIYDARGVRKDVFIEREPVFVKIRFRVPDRASRDTLSVAYSIKNLRGNDLIVSTTWDQKVVSFGGESDEFEVTFEFENCLNTGKYLLVAALEDRASAGIQYYEYIEGAQYFSSLFEVEYCGIFLPHTRQRISDCADLVGVSPKN